MAVVTVGLVMYYLRGLNTNALLSFEIFICNVWYKQCNNVKNVKKGVTTLPKH